MNEVGYEYRSLPRRIKMKLNLLIILLVTTVAWSADSSRADPSKERAAAALEQAVKTDPSNAELWLHLGFAYRKTGQIDQSQSAFEKAAALNPHEPDAFYMLGLIYESKHDEQAAEKAWKSYLAAESDASKRVVAEKHLHHLSQ